MRAVLLTQYGPPEGMRLGELPAPTPRANEVLIRVRASSVNAADWRVSRADPFLVRLAYGLCTPRVRVLGAGVAGVVEAVGPSVTRFKPGDAVFGELLRSGFGAFAELVAAPETSLAAKPDRVTFEAAAAAPLAAVTALQALRDVAALRPGDSVVISGASGGVGTFALQLAKALGAGEVTAVCSERNAELARSLGADRVIDYAREDFTAQRDRYDVIVAVNGYHPISHYARALAPGGRYAMIGGTGRQLAEVALLGALHARGGRRFGRVDVRTTPEDLAFVRASLEAGAITPVIDRRYPLEEAPSAVAYLEAGHARGKVVVAVA